MPKIPYSDALSWLQEYYTSKNEGKQTQRLGQAFLNRFCKEESNSALFYEEDGSIALDVIGKNYIDYER